MMAAFIGLVRKVGIAGDASRIMLFQLVALLISLASSVLVARVLGPENKGIFDLYSLMVSLTVEVGLLGLPAGLLYSAMTRGDPMAKVHGTGLGLVLLLSVLVAGCLALWGGHLLLFFPTLPVWVLDMVLLTVPARLYMAIWGNLLIAQNRAVRMQEFSTMFGAANLCVVLVLYSVHQLDVRNCIWASVVLSILIAMRCFFYLRRGRAHLEFDRGIAVRSFRFGLPVFVGSVTNLLHFKVDQLMISSWVGMEGVGLYALSVRWAEMLFLLDAAILTSALYRIGSSRHRESREFSMDIMLIQFVVNIAAALGLAVFVWFGFEPLYGSEYAAAITPLFLLMPGVLVWSTMKPIANYYTYRCGKAGVLGWLSALGLLLNIVLNYLFIKQAGLGIQGAALASSISYVFVALTVGAAAYVHGRAVDAPV